MIVTAHQPNFLPGKSVLDKIAVSDAIIWLDEVQYTKGGYTNRNRLPDGSWFTVPIERLTDGKPINRVRIRDDRFPRWTEKACKTLVQTYGHSYEVDKVCGHISRPYKLLVGLNLALLSCFDIDCWAEWHFQSHLDGGHAVRAVSEDAEELLPISDRLAMMVAELGGTSYLSGPSGRRYLDESPFHERGIKVDYFEYAGSNNPNALQVFAGTRRRR